MDGATREGRVSLPFPHTCLAAIRTCCLLVLLLPLPVLGQIHPIELEGFIVTGTPIPVAVGTETSHVTVLEGSDLDLKGTASVADLLAEVPGLTVVRNGSFGSVVSAFLRGAEADQVKILVDGVTVNQAGGAYDLAGLLLSDVDRIEVARGPASALYGSDAMAGVIQIFTRRGEGPLHGSLIARAGSYASTETSISIAGGRERASYAFAFARTATDGILKFNNRAENAVFSGTVTAQAGESTQFSFSGRYGDRSFHFPTDGSGNVVDHNAFSFGTESSFSAQVSRSFGQRVEVAAAAAGYAWDGGSEDRPDGPADTLGNFSFTSHDDFSRVEFNLRAVLAVANGATLSAGSELEQVRQQSSSISLSQFGSSEGESRFHRINRALYAHMVTRSDRWLGMLGGRVEDNEQYGRFLTFQVGFSHAWPRSGTRLRGSLGKGLKEPTFLETSAKGYAVGNPDLRPEQSTAWELGLEQTAGHTGARVTISVFRQSLSDLIQYTFTPPHGGAPNYFNVAEARTEGVETELRFPWGPLMLSGGYTYLRSRVLDAGFDEGAGAVFVEGQPLIRRPTHEATADARYLFSRGELRAGVHWIGSRPDRDFSSWPAVPVILPGYATLRLAAEVQILDSRGSRPGLRALVSGENLLDEVYQGVFGFDAPGRSVYFGLSIPFGVGGEG